MFGLDKKKKRGKIEHTYHEEIAEARTKIPISTIFRNNFVGGLGWGFGSVVGATFLVAIIGFILSTYGDLPIIGNIVAMIAKAAQKGTQNFPR